MFLFPGTGLFSVEFRLAEVVEGDKVLTFQDPIQFHNFHPGMNFLRSDSVSKCTSFSVLWGTLLPIILEMY